MVSRVTSSTNQLTYGTHIIEFQLVYRARKTLSISVHPCMKVEVIAPVGTELSDIYEKVQKRARWILSQIRFFQQFYPKLSDRYFISGETHYYLGKQYRLKVTKDLEEGVKCERGSFIIRSRDPENPIITRNLLKKWYQIHAKKKFSERLKYCIEHLPANLKVIPNGLIIRHMTRRWGSMTPSMTMLLNSELIKASLSCIDYVIIHELCHLKHPNHGKSFYTLLGQVMPDWEKRKQLLEESKGLSGSN